MQTKLVIATIIIMMITSCENDNNRSNFEIGEGFEIYQTVKPYIHNLNFDYSTINFDTILLCDEPMLRYQDIEVYDTSTHKLTLGISHDSVKLTKVGVYGDMFVVTMDKEPIYCGFNWSVISSIPCNWVYIMEPYYGLDGLEDNEVQISFSKDLYADPKSDPRLDQRITDRLNADNKLK